MGVAVQNENVSSRGKRGRDEAERGRTDNALPEVVGLALSGLVARELPVDLVLDIGHGDESGHDTTPAAGLDYIVYTNRPSAPHAYRQI